MTNLEPMNMCIVLFKHIFFNYEIRNTKIQKKSFFYFKIRKFNKHLMLALDIVVRGNDILTIISTSYVRLINVIQNSTI